MSHTGIGMSGSCTVVCKEKIARPEPVSYMAAIFQYFLGSCGYQYFAFCQVRYILLCDTFDAELCVALICVIKCPKCTLDVLCDSTGMW